VSRAHQAIRCRMRCAHWDQGECCSCGWLPMSYRDQLAAKKAQARELLALASAPDVQWLVPVPSPRVGFRNKAKMVVSGSVADPVLGLDGVDLCDCPLYPPQLQSAFAAIKSFISTARLTPYQLGSIDAGKRKSKHSQRGELKYVIVTIAPTGQLMIRFVLRSFEAIDRIRKHLPELQTALPDAVVISVNIQSEHKAILEGEQEIVLTEQSALPMPLDLGGDTITLHLGPRAFFQTNTEIAARLYQTARQWANETNAQRIWDLYCGVGGFALACAGPGRRTLGIETSGEAIASARLSVAELEHRSRPSEQVDFEVGDAVQWVLLGKAQNKLPNPDLVIVNPPRRGIGRDLAAWLENSPTPWVIYSSCNPASLATDLTQMPSFRITKAQVLDMFPNTSHYEVIVLLQRN